MSLEGYLTTTEVSQKSDPHVSRTRVRQVALKGRFPGAVKVGRDWLIPLEDFEKWNQDPRRLHWKQSREAQNDLVDR